MSSVTLCMDRQEGGHVPRLKTFASADGRTLDFYVKDSDGNAVDFTGKSCSLVARNGGVNGDLVVDLVGMIAADATGGHLQFVDDPVRMDSEAELDAQIHVRNDGSGDMDYTQRFIIDVQPVISGSGEE